LLSGRSGELFPGWKEIISLAALRLLSNAGSAEGFVLGTAGRGAGLGTGLTMTTSGEDGGWKAGVQVTLP
jgi:hypothetical protein